MSVSSATTNGEQILHAALALSKNSWLLAIRSAWIRHHPNSAPTLWFRRRTAAMIHAFCLVASRNEAAGYKLMRSRARDGNVIVAPAQRTRARKKGIALMRYHQNRLDITRLILMDIDQFAASLVRRHDRLLELALESGGGLHVWNSRPRS